MFSAVGARDAAALLANIFWVKSVRFG